MELFETIKNIILGIIIGFLYYLLIFKISDSIYADENPTDRIQKSVLTIYVVSILSIYASNTILSKSNEFKNNMLKYGIIIGSLSLLYNSLILNWDNLNDSNKIVLLGLNFGLVIWYIYSKKEDLVQEDNLDKKRISKLKKKLKKHQIKLD
jgi:hypothetical protein